MTSEQLAALVNAALEDLKAVDIHVADVRKLTSIADIMIFASGNSNRQVRSLAEHVAQSAKAKGILPLGVEGLTEGEWALVDLGDVIVHIMRPATRDHYQLEKLWSPELRQQSSQ